MSTAAGGHRPQLDSLRFLAFLGVFIFHFDEKTFAYGSLGVPLFFVLSGFLITRLLLLHESGNLARDLSIFYARRTLRIFPLYYFVLLVWFMAGRLEHPIWHVFYLHNVFLFLSPENPGVTGHFWSLSVEEQFYLLYPILLLRTPAGSRVLMLMGLLAVSLLSRILLHLAFPETRYWALLPVAGEYLVCGCFAGLYDVCQPNSNFPVQRFVLLGLLLHAFAAVDQFVLHLIHRPQSAGLYQCIHGLGFALVVLSLWRLRSGWLMQMLTFGPIVYLGKISYALYIFHNFCYGSDKVMIEHFPWLSWIPGPVLVFAVTVSLAAISWHFFEAPLNRLKDHFPYRPTGSLLGTAHSLPGEA